MKTKGLILALLVLMSIAFYTGRVTSKQDSIIVKNDSIEVLRNRSNEYYSRTEAYVVKISELESANRELYKEVKKLKGKPLTVETVQTTISYSGDLETKVERKDSGEVNLVWSKDTIYSTGNSLKIEGITSLKLDSTFTPLSYSTYLKTLEIASKLYIIQTEKDGRIYLNARTDYPNLKFTELEGYIVDIPTVKKKAKRIGLGAFIGIDYRGKPNVGVGINYNLITF